MSTTPGPAIPVVLSLRGVSKRFGAVQAVREVSVDCRAGEIHALVGENGSGKSTLLGMASGFLAPDEGSVEIGGRPLHDGVRGRGDPPRAWAWPTRPTRRSSTMSVAENLYLAAPPSAAARLRRHGDLGGAEARGVRVVDSGERALREPLARPAAAARGREGSCSRSRRCCSLTSRPPRSGPKEIEQLHALVFERSRTGVGVMYVSHRLPEVLGIADRITVLRDGVSQGTFEAAGMSEEALVALMIGRPLGQAFPDRDSVRGRPRSAWRSPGSRATGSGRSTSRCTRARSSASPEPKATARCSSSGRSPVSTARPAQSSCNGKALDTRSPVGPLRAGVILLSGDRARESLFPVLSVRANTTIRALGRYSRLRGASPRPRAGDHSRSPAPAADPDGFDRAARPVALGRQPAEGLAHPPVPAGLGARDPRRRAHAGRRRGLPLRHLRGAAREGEGGGCDRRQVERSARARRPL